MAQLTLLDIIARKGSDAVVGLIEEVTTAAPEWGVIPTMAKRGTSYKISRRTALPSGSFRSANSSVVPSASTFVQEVKEMYFFDLQLAVDEAIVKGDDRDIGDILSQEAKGAMQSVLISLGSQTWYGTTADANGFAGVRAVLTMGTDNVAAGGTTNSTSAYLVWMDPQGVQLLVGLDGELSLKPWALQQQVINTTTGARRMEWCSNLSGYFGLQVGSTASAWAITGVTLHEASSAYDQGVTDRRGAQLLSKVPMARRNNLRWFMNRTAALTLQASRSAIGNVAMTGGAWAPMPVECCGVPITVTDTIVDTETNS